MISLATDDLDEIAVLGAHCDDIAIGMGGTLTVLARQRPGLVVHALVLSGRGTDREIEERAALNAFCPGADVRVTVLGVPDGRAPGHWEEVKQALSDFHRTCRPQVVFGPQRGDAHQDHRLLAELIPTEFRDQLVLGYEILKWESDTPQPNFFHSLTLSVAEEKARLLHKFYPSQTNHDWFDEQAFLGLARLRGVQCRADYAEAFVVEKATARFGSSPARRSREEKTHASVGNR